jgi:hypothetical protein
MIKAHRLTKRYGDKTAVEDLCFTVRPGDRDRLSRAQRRRDRSQTCAVDALADARPHPTRPTLYRGREHRETERMTTGALSGRRVPSWHLPCSHPSRKSGIR